MQLTDWLVVVFVVAIIVVMLDGVRRKVQERRNRVVLKIDPNLPREEFDEEKLASAELPNGGARTLPRTDQPAPTLRKLKSASNFNNPPASGSTSGRDAVNTVPVLMDSVELEEEHIEHTNVFADSGTAMSFEADKFDQEFDEDLNTSTNGRAQARQQNWDEDDWNNAAEDRDELDDDGEGFDEDFEEDDEEVSPMLRDEAVTSSTHTRGLETRYQGRDDDDYEDEDEDELVEEEFDDDDFDDEDDDEEDEDDLDDDFDDDDDEEEDEDELEEDLEEDDEVDELGGYPEDEWGVEEEQDLLVDDYENEPVLLQDTYNKAASHFSRTSQHPRIEPGFGNDDGFDEESLDEDFSAATTDEIETDEDDTLTPLQGTRRSAPEPAPARTYTPAAADATASEDQTRRRHEQSELHHAQGREKAAPAASTRSAAAARQEPADSSGSGPQEVIIINVMARPGQMLKGSELLPVLQQQGLRLGDMSIFHRHADANGNGPIVFSMANMVKPGTFDLRTMETFVTPGISLFLQMPNSIGNMAAFDLMLGTASALRNALGGELKDENRSVFTRQTVEHCRQRVSDFELALLSRK